MDPSSQLRISGSSSASVLRSSHSVRAKGGECQWSFGWILSYPRKSSRSRFRTPSSKSKEIKVRKLDANPIPRRCTADEEQSMSATQSAVNAYYLPKPSRWPVTGACALLLSAAGAATWINHGSAGPYIIAAGMALLVYMLFGWFGTVIRESEAGLYDKQVDLSYRWAMGWFIFSETMFFAAFFGALFYMRWHAFRTWHRATPEGYGRASREIGRQAGRRSRAR